MNAPVSRILRVSEVVDETDTARSFVFDADDLDYRPGQFLTVRVPGDGRGPVARCYSLSSAPGVGAPPQVTVKRDGDGYASNWLCDHVEPGTELEVLDPAGNFTPSSLDDDLVLFAAGSGITPVMSLVRAVLARGRGRLALCYANRDENSVIFARALRELVADHPDRLTVSHWLESLQGLPTADALRTWAAPYAGREAFVCGPRPFMKAATTALTALDVPRSRRHVEKFVSLGGDPFADAVPAGRAEAPDPTPAPGPDPGAANGAESAPTAGADPEPVALTVTLDGTEHTSGWPRDRRLLDHLLDSGLDAPYSCREGRCSACACRVVSGEVTMPVNEVLDAEDLADGIVLACQALPVTDEVSVSYE